MKIFSNREPISRKRAMSAVMVNQAATPGLGSLMCGHRLAGLGQLLLALIGFFAVMIWMIRYFAAQYESLGAESAMPAPKGTMGWVGGLIFFAAWLWAGVTSLTILSEADANDRKKLASVPPRIQ